MLGQALLVAFVSAISYSGFYFYTHLGFHQHSWNHKPGKCRYVEGLNVGSENFKTTSAGLTFITSGILSPSPDLPSSMNQFLNQNSLTVGRIFLYDFNEPSLGAIQLQINPSSSFNKSAFHPAGLDILEDKSKGEHLIYVVNHHDDHKDRIEKFRFLPTKKSLQHIHSFQNSEFSMLNDVAVVSEDTFYVSKSSYFTQPVLMAAEFLLPLYLGSLLLANGDSVSTAASKVNGPNGLTFSADGRYLYVLEYHEKQVSVWSRKENGDIEVIQRVPVYCNPDNAHISATGDDMYIGCHPALHRSLAALGDPTGTTPARVLSLPLQDGKVVTDQIEELYYDDGNFQKGATSANILNGQLLIGSMLDKLVVCDISK